jgi:hypothetical protein
MDIPQLSATTRPHTGTSAPCDPTISSAIDRVITQLEDPSMGRLQRVVLKLRKRWIERNIPAYGANEVQL